MKKAVCVLFAVIMAMSLFGCRTSDYYDDNGYNDGVITDDAAKNGVVDDNWRNDTVDDYMNDNVDGNTYGNNTVTGENDLNNDNGVNRNVIGGNNGAGANNVA